MNDKMASDFSTVSAMHAVPMGTSYTIKVSMMGMAVSNAPEGISVNAYQLHGILTGKVGSKMELDQRHNPHLATFYSWTPAE